MLGFQIDQAKSFFLDRPKIMAMMSDFTQRYLNRKGAYIRKVARNSMKKRPKKPKGEQVEGAKGLAWRKRQDRWEAFGETSRPGQPPHVHEGSLKRFLYYAYDRNSRSVVVGPAKTNQVFFGKDRRPVSGTVPEILEEGGAITIFEIRRFGRWRRADLRSRRRIADLADKHKRFRTVEIAARPYMKPALDAANLREEQFLGEARRGRTA